MKPENWNELTDAEKDRDARELFRSARGTSLVSAAMKMRPTKNATPRETMEHAIKMLSAQTNPPPPYSDIDDMEEILERIYQRPQDMPSDEARRELAAFLEMVAEELEEHARDLERYFTRRAGNRLT